MATEVQPTKERLLDAAELMFAEHGFDGVSIRDLSAAADVNVAAVNYHFQSKENLYAAVMSRRLTPIRTRMLAAINEVTDTKGETLTLEDLIRTFVTTYLEDALAHPHRDTFLRLLMRELHEPRLKDPMIFKDWIIPVHMAFGNALTAARPEIDWDKFMWIMASIIGQVAHFVMRWRRGNFPDLDEDTRQAPRELFPPLADSLDVYIHQVVEHVTCFSVGGIEACTRQ